MENMSKRVKIILSVVGIAAVVVPALLLVFLSSGTQPVPQVSQAKRSVDVNSLEDTVKRTMPDSNAPAPLSLPSQQPSPSPSASPSSSGGPGR